MDVQRVGLVSPFTPFNSPNSPLLASSPVMESDATEHAMNLKKQIKRLF